MQRHLLTPIHICFFLPLSCARRDDLFLSAFFLAPEFSMKSNDNGLHLLSRPYAFESWSTDITLAGRETASFGSRCDDCVFVKEWSVAHQIISLPLDGLKWIRNSQNASRFRINQKTSFLLLDVLFIRYPSFVGSDEPKKNLLLTFPTSYSVPAFHTSQRANLSSQQKIRNRCLSRQGRTIIAKSRLSSCSGTAYIVQCVCLQKGTLCN